MATATGNYRTWTPDSGIPPPPGYTPPQQQQYRTWTPDSGIPPPPGHAPEPAAEPQSPDSDFFGSFFGDALKRALPGGNMIPDRVARDVGVNIAKGAVAIPQAATGLVDIALPGMLPQPVTQAAQQFGVPLHGWAGKMQESLGIKYKETQDILQSAYSPEMRKAQAEVDKAEGFTAKIGAALKNPSVIAASIGESIPTMVASGLLGGGLGALGRAEGLLAKYGFAIGEGAMSAGATQEQTRAESPTGFTTPQQSGLALGTGALTGLISGISGKVANKLGIEDPQQWMKWLGSNGAKGSSLGLAARLLAGFVTDGTEEAVQSAQEQIAGNLAQGKQWNEGVKQSAAMGLLTGGPMGAAAQLRPVSRAEARKAGVPEEIIRQGQEARTGWMQQPPEVQDAIRAKIQDIATAVDSGDITKKDANARLKDLHKQYVQPPQAKKRPFNATWGTWKEVYDLTDEDIALADERDQDTLRGIRQALHDDRPIPYEAPEMTHDDLKKLKESNPEEYKSLLGAEASNRTGIDHVLEKIKKRKEKQAALAQTTFATNEEDPNVRDVYVAGERKGSTETYAATPDVRRTAERMFPGIIGDAPLRRFQGIILNKSEQGKGIGKRMFLDAFAQDPNAWFYNSQLGLDPRNPQATNALASLYKDGLVEVLHILPGGTISRDKPVGDLGVWMARLTDKGRAFLGITQEPTDAITQQGTKTDDVSSSPRVESDKVQGTEPVSSQGVREGGQAGSQGEAQGTATPQTEKAVDAEVLPPQQPPPAAAPQPSGPLPDTTGSKHAKTDELRAVLGLPPRVPTTPSTVEEWHLRAAQTIAADPGYAEQLVNALAERAPDLEIIESVLQQRINWLEQERRAGRGDMAAMQNAILASENIGTMWGKQGNMRQAEMSVDNSLPGLIRRASKVVNRALTPDEIAPLEKKAAEYEAKAAELQKQLDAERAQRLDAIDSKLVAKAQSKRDAMTLARAKKLLKTAAEFGLDENEVQATAEAMAKNANVTVSDYNRALKQAQSMTGLDRDTIAKVKNAGGDVVANTPGLDVNAERVSNESTGRILGLPTVSEGIQTADIAQAVVDAISAGPRKPISWHERIQQAAESLAKEKGLTPKTGEAFEFPWEQQGDFFEGEAEGTSKGRKQPEQRAKATEARKAAVDKLKKAWQAFGQMGAISDPKAEAEKLYALTTAALDVARAYLDEGIARLSQFLKSTRDAIGGDWDKIRPHLVSAWSQLREAGEIPVADLTREDMPAIGREAQRLHREFVEAGIPDRESRVEAVWHELQRSVPDLTRTETVDAMSGYGDFKELPKDDVSLLVRKDKGELQQLRKIEDLNNAIRQVQVWRSEGIPDDTIAQMLADEGYLPKKSGLERRKVDPPEAALISEVNELKKKLPVQPIPSDRQVATAFSTSKATLLNRLNKLKEALRTGKQIPEAATPQYSAEHQAELDKIRQEIEFLTEVYRRVYPTKAQKAAMERKADAAAQSDFESEGGQGAVLTEQQRILGMARVLDGIAKREQAELDRLKQEGWTPKSKGTKLTSPMLDAKQAEIDATRAKIDELLKLDPAYQADVQARSSAAYTRMLTTRIAKNTERLADMERTGQLPEKKPPRTLTPEQLKLKKELQTIAAESQKVIDDITWKNLPRIQKLFAGFGATLKGLASIWGSWDVSFIGRQGMSLAVSHPIKAAKAQLRSYGAFWSEDRAFAIQEEIRNRPNAVNGIYDRMKLDLTRLDGPAVLREEQYAVHWPEKIPILGRGIKASGRAFVAQGNQQRADVADAMLASLLRNGPAEATDAELQIIGHYVNAASWRGDVGNYVQAVTALNNFFWTTRGIVGNFQNLFATALWAKQAGHGTWRVRKLIAKEFARQLAGRAVVYSSAAAFLLAMLGPPSDDEDKGWSISLNPYSPDFGKIRIGRRRIDIMGGLGSYARVTTRLGTNLVNGVAKIAFGVQPSKKSEEEMEKTGTIVSRFLGSKIVPAGSMGREVLTGETFTKEPVTIGSLALSAVSPLSVEDVYTSLKDFGLPGGVALSILALHGLGGQTYTQRPQQNKSKGLKIGGVGKL